MRAGLLSDDRVRESSNALERLLRRLWMLERELERHERVIQAIASVPPSPDLPEADGVQRAFPLTEFAMGPGRDMPLPDTLEDVAEVIGRENALRLSEGLPSTGQRPWRKMLYVPRRMRSDHPVMQLIGKDAAEALSQSHTNMIIEIPVCQEIQRAYRDHVIAYLRQQGLSRTDVARLAGVSIGLVVSNLLDAPEETTADRDHDAPE